MLASADNAEERARIYSGLVQRNRLVGLLRIGLPILGALVLVGLVAQLVVASLLDQFGISNLSIDRGNLVIETPSYSSMTPDGTQYTVSSQGARAALSNTDLIYLSEALLTVTKPSGSWMTAKGEDAQMHMSGQMVAVPGVTEIADSRGTAGTIEGVKADLLAGSMVSEGRASIRYYNGTTIDADSMSYDARKELWVFNRVTLTVPSTPGEPPQADLPPPAQPAGTVSLDALPLSQLPVAGTAP